MSKHRRSNQSTRCFKDLRFHADLLTGLPKTRPWQPQKRLQMGRTFLAYAFEMRGEISKLDLERKSQWTIQNGASRYSKKDAKRSEGIY